jgi:hypothetical protein
LESIVKVAGLKIEKGVVSGALVEKGFRRTELLDSFMRSFATDADLIEILNNTVKAGEAKI